jgi:hypothetical protein
MPKRTGRGEESIGGAEKSLLDIFSVSASRHKDSTSKYTTLIGSSAPFLQKCQNQRNAVAKLIAALPVS